HVIGPRGERRGGGAGDGAGAPIPAAPVGAHRPILFSLLVIIAAYIPLLPLQRVERRLFTPMALTVCYALLGSLLLSLTLIPALSTYVFRGRTAVRQHRLIEQVNRWYARAIDAVIGRAGWVVTAAAIVVAGAGVARNRLRPRFSPPVR